MENDSENAFLQHIKHSDDGKEQMLQTVSTEQQILRECIGFGFVGLKIRLRVVYLRQYKS